MKIPFIMLLISIIPSASGDTPVLQPPMALEDIALVKLNERTDTTLVTHAGTTMPNVYVPLLEIPVLESITLVGGKLLAGMGGLLYSESLNNADGDGEPNTPPKGKKHPSRQSVIKHPKAKRPDPDKLTNTIEVPSSPPKIQPVAPDGGGVDPVKAAVGVVEVVSVVAATVVSTSPPPPASTAPVHRGPMFQSDREPSCARNFFDIMK